MEKLLRDIPLAPITSFGCGGNADFFIEIQSFEQLVELLKTELPQPLQFIGQGCNSVISSRGLSGTTIHLNGGLISRVDDTMIRVDAGVEWDVFVEYCIAQQLWGVELMSGIPSSIGGAVIGNIAAYGQAVSDTLVSILVFDATTQTTREILAQDLQLRYRGSDLQTSPLSKLCVLSATFKLNTQTTKELEYESALAIARELGLDHSSLTDRRTIIIETRRRAGSLRDKDSKNAGSFFKNPIVTTEQAQYIASFDETGKTAEQISKMNAVHGGNAARVSAAHVLLAGGYKRGQVIGNIRLHPDHVLKVENYTNASSQEIYDVTQGIIKDIYKKTGILLEPEVRFIGSFDEQ
jgi:UDP-N-acetylmuramate dehydrogenase